MSENEEQRADKRGRTVTHVELHSRSRLLCGGEPRTSKQGRSPAERVGGGVGGAEEAAAAGARPEA